MSSDIILQFLFSAWKMKNCELFVCWFLSSNSGKCNYEAQSSWRLQGECEYFDFRLPVTLFLHSNKIEWGRIILLICLLTRFNSCGRRIFHHEELFPRFSSRKKNWTQKCSGYSRFHNGTSKFSVPFNIIEQGIFFLNLNSIMVFRNWKVQRSIVCR